jgi:hypothetical protein
MNKWSTSLPSIISLSADGQFDFNPTFMQSTGAMPATSSALPSRANANQNRYGGSLTDLSILIHNQSESFSYNSYASDARQQASKPSPCFYDTSIEHGTDMSTHEQFVPDDQLVQSLVAYADSFDLDTTIYSIQNTANGPTTSMSSCQTTLPRQRAKSTTAELTSVDGQVPIPRHKSCEDLSLAGSISSTSKTTTVIPRQEHVFAKNLTRFVPSESHPQFLFAKKPSPSSSTDDGKFDGIHAGHRMESRTNTLDGSRGDWAFSSNAMNELSKPSNNLFANYGSTTNIEDINMHYLHDLERISSMGASMDFSHEMSAPIPPPPPMIIRKKVKDLVLKQKVDIQLLRPPTPPAPAPIIIREIRPKVHPNRQPITIHQRLEASDQIHLSKTPPPIIFRERPPARPTRHLASHPTIVYRNLPAPPAATPPPSTVVMERLRANSSAVIQKPAPILIEKWLPYPPEQKRKIIYERATPLPIRHKRQANGHTKQVIVEYDQINVIVDKDVKQRKEIKRIHPEHYIEQYGNSLYSNETVSDLLTNVTCGSQVAADWTHQLSCRVSSTIVRAFF